MLVLNFIMLISCGITRREEFYIWINKQINMIPTLIIVLRVVFGKLKTGIKYPNHVFRSISMMKIIHFLSSDVPDLAPDNDLVINTNNLMSGQNGVCCCKTFTK